MGGEAVFWLWLLCDDCIGVTESLLVGQVMLGKLRMLGWLVGRAGDFRNASDVWALVVGGWRCDCTLQGWNGVRFLLSETGQRWKRGNGASWCCLMQCVGCWPCVPLL